MPNRKRIPSFSPFLYRYRNLVERFFNKIKHFRGAVSEKYIAFADRIEQSGGGAPVMRLSRRQREHDRPTIGIDEGMDLGGQAAPRAPHASGVKLTSLGGLGRAPLFRPLAAC